MERYVCIHGHFYQPPRENPWLEDVELQDSAYPFHDWNMRITEECYKQNGSSRILGSDRKIVDIVNNYINISFNFGPTLLSWLEDNAPDVYQRVIEADEKSQELYSGHGAAIAQVYNHMILPLANIRDKHTQVIWGIKDFEHRFNRRPEGMWLPETAVDIETLEVLAEHGIKFTILAPRQASKIREIGAEQWNGVSEENLDVKMPYVCNLPSGKSISLFFYHGDVAHDVAYGGLLHSGENFAARIIEAFEDNGNSAQLIHIATDGESFGHHHRHGDMALAYCLHHIRNKGLARVTIYAEYLEMFPPTYEVQIRENSSWSCVHGVERWKSNCGCSSEQSLSGKQQWRGPLRNSLDWLRDKAAEVYEKKLSQFNKDPWGVRNDYIEVVRDRSVDNVNAFIKRVAGKELGYEDQVVFLKLMEMQRMAMLMYTSCGWFFDNLSGIETVQVMQYAARCMQLYDELMGEKLCDEFENRLAEAPVSSGHMKNGKDIYENYIKPSEIDLYRVGAHFALSSIFAESTENEHEVYCYTAIIDDYRHARAGSQILATGKAMIQSHIVREKQNVDFATLHMGGHNLFTALSSPMPDEEFHRMQQDLEEAFYKGDTNAVLRQINVKFGGNNYSIWHLFRDEQRRLVYEMLSDTWEEIDGSFRHIYEQNYSIMLMLRNMNINLPAALAAPAEFIINQDLCQAIQAEEMNVDLMKELTGQAERLSLKLDKTTIRYEASSKINSLMEMFEQSRDNTELLYTLEGALYVLKGIVPDMDLQAAQNLFFSIRNEKYPEMKKKAESQEDAAKWVKLFERVAKHLDLVI